MVICPNPRRCTSHLNLGNDKDYRAYTMFHVHDGPMANKCSYIYIKRGDWGGWGTDNKIYLLCISAISHGLILIVL